MNKSFEVFKKAVQSSGKPADNREVFSGSLFKELGKTYVHTVSTFADLDNATVRSNDALISNGLIYEERFVSLESAMFLAENFALLLGMLICNYNDFRTAVIGAVDTELDLDGLQSFDRKSRRQQMCFSKRNKEAHTMEIGISVFSDEICLKLYEAAEKNFERCSNSPLKHLANEAVAAFTDQDRKVLGMILANYIYIIRAINNNYKFFTQLARYVSNASAHYGLR